MRDRNTGNTEFPEGIRTPAAFARQPVGEGILCSPLGNAKIGAQRFGSTISLTVLVASLSASSVFAQTPVPAPVPAGQAAPPAAAQVPPATPSAPVAATPAGQGLVLPPTPVVPKGRIRVFVRDVVTNDLLNDAAIFADDPTRNDLRTVPYYANSDRLDENGQKLGGPGFAITDALSVHTWVVIVLKEGYQTGRAVANVVDGTTVDVTVYMRRRERIEPFILVSTRDTTNTTRRTITFVRNIPVGVGNRQEINSVLASTPGFVRNSLGQVHPRGQRFGIATSIDNFLLPDLPTGLLQGLIPQDMIATYDIRHGNLSPEYGGDVGVAVNLTTRSVGSVPLVEGLLTSGGYSTDEAYVTVGQRFGMGGRLARSGQTVHSTGSGPIGGAFEALGSRAPFAPSFAYLLNISQRNTTVVTDAPQRSPLTTNNVGYNDLVFGKVELNPNPLLQVTGIIDINGARSGIANRTRTSGVGYLGSIETISPAGGSLSGAQQQAVANSTFSQDESYQNQFQKENNGIALLQMRRLLSPRDLVQNPDSTLTISVGGVENTLRLENHNSNFDPRDLTNPLSGLYQRNSSLEYNPTIRRYYDQLQSQVDLVLSRQAHVIKAGVLINNFRSEERYSFQPGSQVALDALYARSPLLVSSNVIPDQSGARDGFGNQIVHYQTTTSSANPGVSSTAPSESPVSRLRRNGDYTAVYVQDTWAINGRFTVNSGVRLDAFSLTALNGGSRLPTNLKTDVTDASPRLNFAYTLGNRGILGFLGGHGLRRSILRASYDRLFERPPLGQGTYFGAFSIRPQTGDQYEISLEKQLGKDQLIKAAVYSTKFSNFLDAEGIFPGAQFSTGALLLVNYPKAISEGFELSYNYNPNFRAGNPLSFFATYSNGGTRLRHGNNVFDSLGRVVTASRASFDQEHTINFGASVKIPGNSTFGASTYIGSGLYGSRAADGKRAPVGEVNLHLATNPRLFQRTFGFDLAVENLFDQKDRFNYFTALEGIRYQTGRRILTSVYCRF